MKNNFILFLFLLLPIFCFAQMPKKAEIVSVNGKDIYYEVYGKGEPLLLLHGYTMSSKAWVPYVADFMENYEVYLIDLTGHGKSTAFTEDLSIKSVAEDLNALTRYLKLEKLKAIGFSYGGDVLFQLALLDSSLIESMVTIGSLGSWDIKDYPELETIYSYKNIEDFSWMRAYHSSEEKIHSILNQFKNYTVKLSEKELESIQTKILLVLGDDDTGMPLEEVARVRKYLPHSDLWILPNVAHGVHEGLYKEDFIKKAEAFLIKPIEE